MARAASFWPEVLDLGIVYLISGGMSTPFLFLVYLAMGTAYFHDAILLLLCVVGISFLGMNVLSKRVHIFSQPKAAAIEALPVRSLVVSSRQSRALMRLNNDLAYEVFFRPKDGLVYGQSPNTLGPEGQFRIRFYYQVVLRMERNDVENTVVAPTLFLVPASLGHVGPYKVTVGPGIKFFALSPIQPSLQPRNVQAWGVGNVQLAAS